uniref:CaM_binding domain-containing protein n=1 Tax=Heterorhabditis bacteriophora TaxID=37862 RepID=A0A1I7WQS1_HETBA
MKLKKTIEKEKKTAITIIRTLLLVKVSQKKFLRLKTFLSMLRMMDARSIKKEESKFYMTIIHNLYSQSKTKKTFVRKSKVRKQNVTARTSVVTHTKNSTASNVSRSRKIENQSCVSEKNENDSVMEISKNTKELPSRTLTKAALKAYDTPKKKSDKDKNSTLESITSEKKLKKLIYTMVNRGIRMKIRSGKIVKGELKRRKRRQKKRRYVFIYHINSNVLNSFLRDYVLEAFTINAWALTDYLISRVQFE